MEDSIDTTDEDYEDSQVKTISEENEEKARRGSDNSNMLMGRGSRMER